MAVKAAELQGAASESFLCKGECLPGLHRNTEFDVYSTGINCLICVRVYPGRNPEKDLLFFLLRGRFSVDCEEFLRIVNDKVSDIFAYCVTDILVCLAVAVKEDLLFGESDAERSVDLSRRNGVKAHSFGHDDPYNLFERSCFSGVERERVFAESLLESLGIQAAVMADTFFVHKIERSPVFFREIGNGMPREAKHSVGASGNVIR